MPLLVTEGSKKADSAVSHGLVCVSVLGVWYWRGTNPVGGKVALPEWHDMALNGRRVILAFDSDLSRKPGVRKALGELANYLQSKDAKVEYLHLPDPEDGKCGLDDYLAAQGADGIWELVRPEPPAPQVIPPPAAKVSATSATTATVTVPWDGDLGRPTRRHPQVHRPIRRLPVGARARRPHPVDARTPTRWTRGSPRPRIAFLSPEPGSGKTRALEVTELLVPRPVEAVNTTPAYLFRKVSDQAGLPTILLRRDRHAVRPEGEGQRGDPRHAERRSPPRRRRRPVRDPRRRSSRPRNCPRTAPWRSPGSAACRTRC